MSDSEDEDLAKYGRPLEPLDEDSVPRKKPFSLEDQVAKDKYGRRRFHGAFTGGFSAGFFNSVGSLEGWTPSQFKSSRSSKAETHNQKAEDFMDEEDMDEFGFAPKMVRATRDYDNSENENNRKRKMTVSSSGPIPGEPVLKNLLEPVRETVGVKLLMKMGWKPGQGVGPRITRSEKKKLKIYGCVLPNRDEQKTALSGDEESNDGSDNELVPENVTFAPNDYEPYIVKPKDNFFGLGYSGLDKKPVLSSHINLFEPSSLVMRDKQKKVSIRGQAFGVGALEEEDEDIYAKDDMSQYDFALDTPAMMAEKRKREKQSKRLALPSPGVIEGFVLASISTIKKKVFPPPQLPPGFIPQHKVSLTRFEPIINKSTKSKDSNEQRLTAVERAIIVNDHVPAKILDTPSGSAKNSELQNIERTSSNFKPFIADPDKQERYEKYLTLEKLGQSDRLLSLQPLGMTEWERQREKTEFEQASKLFRPLVADMGDRFVSAARLDDDIAPSNTPKPKWSQSHVSNEMVEAAKMKMYGRLTRVVENWYPCGLFCKRFNVPDPHSGTSMDQKNVKSSRPKFSVFNFLEAASHNVHASSVRSDDKPIDVLPDKVVETEPEIVENKVDVQEEKIIWEDKSASVIEFEDPPAKVDLYKAIFLSSSDESESEETAPSKNAESVTQVASDKTPAIVNVLRNTSPPRGIFANLDLDALNKPTKKVQPEPEPDLDLSKKTQEDSKVVESLEVESELYGPTLPVSLPKSRTVTKPVTVYVNSSSDEWTSNDEESPEKKHKHKKKHRKKYKKNKDHKKHRHKKKK